VARASNQPTQLRPRINSKSGILFPPVEGGFIGDRGEFYGTDDDDGRPVKVRFVWTRRGPNAAS
jgi:hypothetical protein